MDRKSLILKWIKDRKDIGEKPTPCVFQITVPKFSEDSNLQNGESIKVVTNILQIISD